MPLPSLSDAFQMVTFPRASTTTAISLVDLPAELLSQIVAHCETAQTLLNLSLTSKRLNDFIRSDGLRVFVQTKFPSLQTPPYWRDAAHALTTLSRNWDRKAFIARTIAPPKLQPLERNPRNAGYQNQRRRQQQTMGYQPVIDSYETWSGGNWISRKEVLVWGAGAELILRSKKTGDLAEQEWHAQESARRRSILDQHHHMHDWFVYKMSGTTDGRDDITSANILRGIDEGPEHVVVGRASGKLNHVRLSIQGSSASLIKTFITGGRSVRSAALSTATQPILAACLADNAIALYPTNSTIDDVSPLDEVAAVPPGAPGRTWSSRFLCNHRLAIGRGPSGQPILIYEIGQTGFSSTPLRRFDMQAEIAEEKDHPSATNGTHTTSIYPIVPIAPSSAAGGAEGDIFLSGGYDGNIRLHDMRSPASSTARFVDIVDNSAIYSLLAFGRERFVAGASRFTMLKIFDLRMPGGKVYHYTDGLSSSPVTPPETSNPRLKNHVASHKSSHTSDHPPDRNYNMYLNPIARNSHSGTGNSLNLNPSRPPLDSPVYSLSSPSAFSPSFYAGVENGVVQLDVVSVQDRHPDPLFSRGIDSGPLSVDAKWDPNRDALGMYLYEHSRGNLEMRHQEPVSPTLFRSLRRFRGSEYWDLRWSAG
ncbi:hypothetical protein G7Y79_00060g092090 [Physcia stellaris]|nr:hypothetical protein G7Y79_00060g092090 [Physcia stellaris]